MRPFLPLFDRHPNLLYKLLPRSDQRLGLSALGRFRQRPGIDPVVSPDRVRPRPEFLAADKIVQPPPDPSSMSTISALAITPLRPGL